MLNNLIKISCFDPLPLFKHLTTSHVRSRQIDLSGQNTLEKFQPIRVRVYKHSAGEVARWRLKKFLSCSK